MYPSNSIVMLRLTRYEMNSTMYFSSAAKAPLRISGGACEDPSKCCTGQVCLRSISEVTRKSVLHSCCKS